jgi:hypothetical protein
MISWDKNVFAKLIRRRPLGAEAGTGPGTLVHARRRFLLEARLGHSDFTPSSRSSISTNTTHCRRLRAFDSPQGSSHFRAVYFVRGTFFRRPPGAMVVSPAPEPPDGLAHADAKIGIGEQVPVVGCRSYRARPSITANAPANNVGVWDSVITSVRQSDHLLRSSPAGAALTQFPCWR